MTRIDYCQFLASSHTNFTMTYFADHTNGLSNDAINRFLRNDKLTGKIIWEHVQGDIVPSPVAVLSLMIQFWMTLLHKPSASRYAPAP